MSSARSPDPKRAGASRATSAELAAKSRAQATAAACGQGWHRPLAWALCHPARTSAATAFVRPLRVSPSLHPVGEAWRTAWCRSRCRKCCAHPLQEVPAAAAGAQSPQSPIPARVMVFGGGPGIGGLTYAFPTAWVGQTSGSGLWRRGYPSPSPAANLLGMALRVADCLARRTRQKCER